MSGVFLNGQSGCGVPAGFLFCGILGFMNTPRRIPLLVLFFFAATASAQQLRLEIPAHAFAHPMATAKAAASSSNKLHQATFWVSTVGAFASLAVDGLSTDYVNRHDTRFYPGTGWKQVSYETFTGFTTNGEISQAKLWGIKSALALAPYTVSWLVHDFAPRESSTVDAIDLALVGTLSGFYVKAGVSNYNQARANINWNKSVGKP